MRKIVSGKLHGIRVTDANLHYHGSITLDPDHCEEAGLMPLQFVDVWNKNTGARISTYVIYGNRGSKCCVLNGAAARTCQVGDEIIVCGWTYVAQVAPENLTAGVITFDAKNEIHDRFRYKVSKSKDGRYDFSIERTAAPQGRLE